MKYGCVHGVCVGVYVCACVCAGFHSVGNIPKGLYDTALEHTWTTSGLTKSKGWKASMVQTANSPHVLQTGCLEQMMPVVMATWNMCVCGCNWFTHKRVVPLRDHQGTINWQEEIGRIGKIIKMFKSLRDDLGQTNNSTDEHQSHKMIM